VKKPAARIGGCAAAGLRHSRAPEKAAVNTPQSRRFTKFDGTWQLQAHHGVRWQAQRDTALGEA